MTRHHSNKQLHGVICCHVDDFCWARTMKFQIVGNKIEESNEARKKNETFTDLYLNVRQLYKALNKIHIFMNKRK